MLTRPGPRSGCRATIRLLAVVASVCPLLPAQGNNTLLIVADDFGVDSVGVYGEGTNPPPTPNIDALAGRGVLFRNAYAGPVCSVTRGCLHTGRYGFRTGIGWVILNNTPAANVLSPAEVKLPQVLSRGGMPRHALIGKWHLGNATNGGNSSPNLAGWSHFDGMIESHPANGYYNWNRVVNGQYLGSTRYATTQLVDSALQWINSTNGPWFCMLSFQAPHWPYGAPPASLSTIPCTSNVSCYRAMSEAMDKEIGRLLATLGPAVLAKTNIIFVGDNGTDPLVSQGPFIPAHAKLSVYEGGINVPLIVAGPAVVQPGREVAALVDTTDIFAAVPELFGIDARQQVPASVPLDAVSFVPYLSNPNQTPLRETVYAEQFNVPCCQWNTDSHAIRNARYKLLYALRNTVWVRELYDLANDPFERTNLLRTIMSADARDNLRYLETALAKLRGTALWMPFGAGCAGSAGVPTFTSAPGHAPRLGSTFTTLVGNAGAGATAAMGVVGASDRVFGPNTLPLDLGLIGMPGCRLFCSIDVVVPLAVQAGGASWPVGIPNASPLLGLGFFQQCAVAEPGANALGLVVTPAAAGVLGR